MLKFLYRVIFIFSMLYGVIQHAFGIDTPEIDFKTFQISQRPNTEGLRIRFSPFNIKGSPNGEYDIDGTLFRRQNVSGKRMHCFFNAVGLNVKKEIAKLSTARNDRTARYMVANEIVSAVRTPDQLSQEIKDAIQYDTYVEEQKNLDSLMIERSDALKVQSPDPNRQDPSRLSPRLQNLDQKSEEILTRLKERAFLEKAFESFISSHIGNEQMMVTLYDSQGDQNYTSIDAIAYLNHFGLKIYQPDPSGGLRLAHQFIPENATEVIYLYHEGIHFQALMPAGYTPLREAPAAGHTQTTVSHEKATSSEDGGILPLPASSDEKIPYFSEFPPKAWPVSLSSVKDERLTSIHAKTISTFDAEEDALYDFQSTFEELYRRSSSLSKSNKKILTNILSKIYRKQQKKLIYPEELLHKPDYAADDNFILDMLNKYDILSTNIIFKNINALLSDLKIFPIDHPSNTLLTLEVREKLIQFYQTYLHHICSLDPQKRSRLLNPDKAFLLTPFGRYRVPQAIAYEALSLNDYIDRHKTNESGSHLVTPLPKINPVIFSKNLIRPGKELGFEKDRSAPGMEHALGLFSHMLGATTSSTFVVVFDNVRFYQKPKELLRFHVNEIFEQQPDIDFQFIQKRYRFFTQVSEAIEGMDYLDFLKRETSYLTRLRQTFQRSTDIDSLLNIYPELDDPYFKFSKREELSFNDLASFDAFLKTLEQNSTDITQVDPDSFTANVFANLVLNFEDGRSDNYRIRKKPNGLQEIIGIDSDRGLSEPLLQKKQKKHTTNLRSIFYCQPSLMHSPLNKERVRFLCSLSPATFLLEWLSHIDRYNKLYQSMHVAGVINEEEIQFLSFPLKFSPGVILTLYTKMCTLLKYLNEDEEGKLTHQALFSRFMPLIGQYYDKINSLFEGRSLSALNNIIREHDDEGNFLYVENVLESTIDPSLLSEMISEAKKESDTYNFYEQKKHTSSVNNEIVTLIKGVDFDSLSPQDRFSFIQAVYLYWPTYLPLLQQQPHLLEKSVQDIARGNIPQRESAVSILMKVYKKRAPLLLDWTMRLHRTLSLHPLAEQNPPSASSKTQQGYPIAVSSYEKAMDHKSHHHTGHESTTTSPPFDVFYLSEAQRNTLFPNGKFKRMNNFMEKPMGKRDVAVLEVEGKGLFFKRFPGIPGFEAAVGTLAHLLFGHGTPYTTLARIKDDPYLISQGMGRDTSPFNPKEPFEGYKRLNLDYVLKNCPDKLKLIDPESLSEAVIMAILTNPEDGQPANYVLDPILGLPNNEERYRLVSIDNDQSFVDEITPPPSGIIANFTDQPHVQVKCWLFCLDQMKNKIDYKVMQKLKQLDVKVFLRQWLYELGKIHKGDQALFTPDERYNLWHSHQVYIGVPFRKGDGKVLATKLLMIHDFLHKNPNATHYQLLTKVQPWITHRYRTSWQQDFASTYPDVDPNLLRFYHADGASYGVKIKKGKTPQISASLSSSHHILDPKKITVRKPIKDAIDEGDVFDPHTIMAELDEFIEKYRQEGRDILLKDTNTTISQIMRGKSPATIVLNLEQYSHYLQQLLFDEILIAKRIKSLSLTHASALTDNFFESSLPWFSTLTQLDARFCPQLTSDIIPHLSRNVPHLRELNLAGCQDITLVAQPRFFQGPGTLLFANLKQLVVNECPNLEHIRIYAPALQGLWAKDCPKLQSMDMLSQPSKDPQSFSDPHPNNFNTLDVRNNPHISESHLELVFNTYPHLTYARISGCRLIELKKIKRIIETYPTLTLSDLFTYYSALRIGLQEADWSENGVTSLALYKVTFNLPILSLFTTLTSLSISSSSPIITEQNFLSSLTKLKTLKLQRDQIDNKDIAYFTHLKCLTDLDLSGNNIGSDSKMYGANLDIKPLSRLIKLVKLNLHNNRRFNDLYADWLEQLPDLTFLDLSYCSITSHGVRGLALQTQLRTLKLSNNRVGENGNPYLTDLINLTELDLEENKLDDIMAEELARLTNLTSLNLRFNLIKNIGSVKKSFSHMKNLHLRLIIRPEFKPEPVFNWNDNC